MCIKNKSQEGFSLIELLVVMAIIGILSMFVFASLTGAIAKARYAKVVSAFQQIEVAAKLFLQDQKFYPCDVPPNQDPGTGGATPEENKYCVRKGLVETKALYAWPKGPCPGWNYDWENWSSLDALPTGNALSHVVRITLRRPAAPTAVYYYCIKDTHGSSAFSCGGKTGDEPFTLGGVKVNYLRKGSLVCS
ncbi:MAG: general secretion pathway protein G [Parcubacteria group bacterium Gr01-1014_48]|nr:MAG: general secretion pathway protein G [Parcubacteria group bacterium Greene0416_14]TSC72554.1 MAG: general secretion pathway protein G [Parcubacteria group bacterium Gr01-1014_48]TSD01333.1 MAG: general secretion pathway protein G [Parcubacteria group bacterium Greene1014_15]TSD08021.1 MAG: general secretion pathway protein G [Parcubacteria group bacterium Greene0714_4]